MHKRPFGAQSCADDSIVTSSTNKRQVAYIELTLPKARAQNAKSPIVPCVLAVGGLDPGGGAGILADARAVKIAGAYTCACVSLLTVQSTEGLVRSTPVSSSDLATSMREVLTHQSIDVIKVGALGTSEQVRVVVSALRAHPFVPSVVDTPRRPSRGNATLIDAKGWDAIVRDLLPLSTILTVNSDEAGWVLDRKIRDVGEAREAATMLAALGPAVVVVKGGHLQGNATDVVAFGASVVELNDRRANVSLHGTGCTFASLIAGRIATAHISKTDTRGQVAAIRWAKKTIRKLIRAPLNVGGRVRVLG